MSIDLIYGRHLNQMVSDWEKELSDTLKMGISHCSLYQLSIEPRTKFHHLVNTKKS